LDYGQPKKLLARFMPSEQHCFDLVFLLTGGQFLIAPPRSHIQRRIVVCMIAVMADYTEKCALVRSIGSIHVVAAMALL